MLLDDRLVGTFGSVAAGDREKIVRIAVDAARRGFGVVPLADDGVPACALTIRESKKPHDCYHVLTVDTQVRAAFNRLTKDGATCNLAIDLDVSMIGVTTDISWWVGPEISPTLVMPDKTALYVFDLTSYDAAELPDSMVTSGTLMVPPSYHSGTERAVELIGQMNYLSDNVRTDKEETVDIADNEAAALSARVESLELKLEEMAATMGKLREALVVALTAMKELQDEVHRER